MMPTKPLTLVVLAVVSAVVAWLVIRVTFATMPLLPVSAIPALLFLAAGEALVGRNLRARLSGRRPGKPVAPIAVARVAALAKASSTAGAVFGGISAGFFIYVAGMLDKSVPRHDAIAAGGTVIAALALVLAALYLENCCRAPDPGSDSDEDEPPDPTGSWHG
jgi:hypothetical protein